jgi:hypothetical protein
VYGGGYPLVNNETAALIVLLGIPVVLAIIRLFSQLLATRKGGV